MSVLMNIRTSSAEDRGEEWDLRSRANEDDLLRPSAASIRQITFAALVAVVVVALVITNDADLGAQSVPPPLRPSRVALLRPVKLSVVLSGNAESDLPLVTSALPGFRRCLSDRHATVRAEMVETGTVFVAARGKECLEPLMGLFETVSVAGSPFGPTVAHMEQYLQDDSEFNLSLLTTQVTLGFKLTLLYGAKGDAQRMRDTATACHAPGADAGFDSPMKWTISSAK
ncbi:hypothetical protein AYL99_11915 [Fonsecaea erecta]|uniref:Uncharacterized protein n=1 Tax=Fonsecaea erecta TaxID=1367422 RepID=A0A178Z3W7_9EURO|nr:hypothetical protein AYL99_11915 [Fonsecaea erecta]OAP53893.1 hypothetical protein AYL99_11915 [Fonsecaea erecta]